MTKMICSIIFYQSRLASLAAHARDDKYVLPIAVALNTKDAQAKLDGSVKFFFANQETPNILVKLGTDVTNLKTSTFPKG
jgi:hypothetical protein